MNEQHWKMFFDLVERIVNQPGLTAMEKGCDVWAKAEELGERTNLAELVAELEDTE